MVTEGIVLGDWRCPRLSRVVHNVNNARKCEKFTDVTFVVGPAENACIIKAHRVVLGTASEELAKLVLGSNRLQSIRIPDVSPKGFKNLIRFLYDIDVKFSDFSILRETFLVAQKYKVYALKESVEDYLYEAASCEYALEVFQIALELEMIELQLICLDTVANNYRDILKSEEFISAPFQVVSGVFGIRSWQEQNCEYQALLAIGKWKKKHEADQTTLQLLLSYVDFTRIQISEFNIFINENDGLLSSDDIEAIRKYIQSNKISDAPEWYRLLYRGFGEKNKDNTENVVETNLHQEDLPENKFSLDMQREKLKVEQALAKELGYIGESLRKVADDSYENYKKSVNESVQSVLDHICSIVREAVETAVENFEDDITYNLKMEGEKKFSHTNGVKESISAKTETVPAPGIHQFSTLSLSECCIKKSDVLKE